MERETVAESETKGTAWPEGSDIHCRTLEYSILIFFAADGLNIHYEAFFKI